MCLQLHVEEVGSEEVTQQKDTHTNTHEHTHTHTGSGIESSETRQLTDVVSSHSSSLMSNVNIK